MNESKPENLEKAVPLSRLGEIGLSNFAPYLMNRIMGRYNADLRQEMGKLGLTTPKMRALAVLSDAPLEVEGIDPVPPITDFMPDFPVAADYFGVFIPVGAPQEVYDTVDKVWADVVMNSPELKAYATERGAVFAPSYGDDALAAAMPVVIAEACARVTRGEAVMDPSEIGITCAAE